MSPRQKTRSSSPMLSTNAPSIPSPSLSPSPPPSPAPSSTPTARSLPPPPPPPCYTPPSDESTQISTTMRIIRKRPCALSASGPSTASKKWMKRSLTNVHRLMNELKTDIQDIQECQQQEALDKVIQVINRPCPSGQFPSICLDTGTSAASGDSSSYESIIDYIDTYFKNDRISIIKLDSSRYDSLRSIADIISSYDSKKSNKRLIITIENAHLFHPDLLSDLIYVIAHKCKQFEYKNIDTLLSYIVTIFIIPHANALYDCLNISDISKLRNTLIQMPTQYQNFHSIIEILMLKKGILFTSSIFQLIQLHFFNVDTSISMVLRTLNQLFALHFHSLSSLSDVISIIDHSDINFIRSKLIQLLDAPYNLQIIDNLHSVQSMPKNKFALDNNELRVEQYAQCILQLVRWKRNISNLNNMAYQMEVELFKSFSSSDPANSNFTSPRVNVFASFLPDELHPTAVPGLSSLSTALKFVRTTPKHELRRLLQIIIERATKLDCKLDDGNANNENNSSIENRAKELTKQIDDLSSTNTNATSDTATPSPSLVTSSIGVIGGTPQKRTAKGGNAAMLRRRQALEASTIQAHQRTPMNKVRQGISKLLEDIYNMNQPLTSLACHELILFTDVEGLRVSGGSLCGGVEPRRTIFQSLRQPSKALNAESLQQVDVPDTSVAFRILAQGGRLVSLYDWYNIFESTRSAAYISANKISVSSSEMQARFARACSELEFIGLLKYTNRKTDHVARLAYE